MFAAFCQLLLVIVSKREKDVLRKCRSKIALYVAAWSESLEPGAAHILSHTGLARGRRAVSQLTAVPLHSLVRMVTSTLCTACFERCAAILTCVSR